MIARDIFKLLAIHFYATKIKLNVIADKINAFLKRQIIFALVSLAMLSSNINLPLLCL